MAAMVAFPDFSANGGYLGGRAFACTLRTGEVGPAWVHVAGALELRGAARLAKALRYADSPGGLIVLDLRALRSIDGIGVLVITDAAHEARRANRRLMVIRGPSAVNQMLVAADCDVLEIVDVEPLEGLTRAFETFKETNDAA